MIPPSFRVVMHDTDFEDLGFKGILRRPNPWMDREETPIRNRDHLCNI